MALSHAEKCSNLNDFFEASGFVTSGAGNYFR